MLWSRYLLYRFVALLAVLCCARLACSDISGSLCYDWDGSILHRHKPCRPDLHQSYCCPRYWTCLDNGICSNQNTTDLMGSWATGTFLVRGSCTDLTWANDRCPRFCDPGSKYGPGTSPSVGFIEKSGVIG